MSSPHGPVGRASLDVSTIPATRPGPPPRNETIHVCTCRTEASWLGLRVLATWRCADCGGCGPLERLIPDAMEAAFGACPEEEDGCGLCRANPGEAHLQGCPAVEKVDHPAHYGGADDPFEAIKVIEAWDAGFNIGSVLKYLRRAGRKAGADIVDDLKKARWYLDREIMLREKERK